MLENRYKEIFDKAAEFGITKRELGRLAFGPVTSMWIYQVGRVTKYEQANYDRLNKALNQLIKERKENGEKN